MSKILNDAKNYIEQSKGSLLITVGVNNVPYVRPIGAFSNEGADIYFTTGKVTEKVKHIKENPTVTFYFQNEGQSIQNFKSVAVIGEAVEILEGDEFDKAVEGISIRYPLIKEKVANGEIKDSAIYKVKAKFIKLADYTRPIREVIENV